MNLRSKLQKPRKLLISFFLVGVFPVRIALVLIGYTLIPSWLTMNPRYSVSVWWNSHFDGFSLIPDWYIALIMFRTSRLCCSRLPEYMRTSSRYTIQQRSIKRWSILLIHL